MRKMFGIEGDDDEHPASRNAGIEECQHFGNLKDCGNQTYRVV